MRKNIILFSLLFISFFMFSRDVNAAPDIRYDITSATVTNNTLTVQGWAFMEGINNGKRTDSGYEYAPAYTMYIKDSDGNIAVDLDGNRMESYYYFENDAERTGDFSLTCVLFTKWGRNGGDNAATCMNMGTAYNERNAMISKSVNQPNEFYDNVDFKISFNISRLKPDMDYHLELQVKVGDTISDHKKIFILDSRVRNYDDNALIETKNTSKFVNMRADMALLQKPGFHFLSSRPYQSGCWFQTGGNYEYLSNRQELNAGFLNGYAQYYYYDLVVPKGQVSGSCGVLDDYPNYKNNNGFYAGAHAAWVEATGDTAFTIRRKNPCATGTKEDNFNPTKYALTHDNECCYEYPQTCCGNPNYINEYIEQVDNKYILSSEYCCKNADEYTIDSEAYKGYSFKTFKYYMNKGQLFYGYGVNPPPGGEHYDQNFINKVCGNPIVADPTPSQACKKGNNKDKKLRSIYNIICTSFK